MQLKLTKEEIINGIKNYKIYLSSLPEELRDNKEIVLEAIKKNFWALEYASDRLRNDKDIVLEAIKERVSALYYASDKLQHEREFLEILEKENPNDWHEKELIDWYNERMEVLANIREKELMENSINSNIKISKKIKF